MASSHSVTGGVYKAWKRIHRRMTDRRLLAIPASCRRHVCRPGHKGYDDLTSSSPSSGLSPYLHSRLLRQTFAHCRKFSTAVSRRSLGRISVPVWLIILSDQLLIIALTRAPPRADSSFCSSSYGVLAAVSSCCFPPKGRFLRVTHLSATENTTSCPTCICKACASVHPEPGSNSP
ncbi:hypothetical protein Ahy_B04g069025 [Arachis hypogaea]|uniref:Uncharacterized protein n=1 Tax=Arachis hypogaea TaxID=3818 RepID=A0A444ZBF8_ARAHY|nr:hypothetical protein Ahy_B04g069025 [Arachis hypogaea]